MQDKGLPILPHQRAELGKARDALNATDRHAAKDMEEAYRRDPGLTAEAARGRTDGAIRAMRLGEIRQANCASYFVFRASREEFERPHILALPRPKSFTRRLRTKHAHFLHHGEWRSMLETRTRQGRWI